MLSIVVRIMGSDMTRKDYAKLTDEEVRIKVAEYDGWKQVRAQFGTVQGIMPPMRGWIEVPDYLNDLNAMHEVEEKCIGLEGEKADRYMDWLQRIADPWDWHAKAAERAEAFVLVMEEMAA